MRHALVPGVLALLAVAGAAPAQPGKAEPPAVVELLEDGVEALARQMQNDGVEQLPHTVADFRDFYSGVCSVRIAPLQRFASRIPGWAFEIAEKPGPGQYRYLRFAWKREGGPGVMIQLHNTAGSWNQRYVAGFRSPHTNGWGPAIPLTDKVPSDWVVVTRDLFKDFGPMTVTGLALTPMEQGGGTGLFDHFYLGRTVADLDRASAAAFRAPAPPGPPDRAALEQHWQDLASRDVVAAGRAVRSLAAAGEAGAIFLAGQLKVRPPSADDKRMAALIADLDDDLFRVREDATRELEKLGKEAVPWLQKAVQGAASLEARRRAKALLDRYAVEPGALTPEQLRLVRAIRVLEWSRTPAALRLLEALADRPLDIGLAADARRALERARKRA